MYKIQEAEMLANNIYRMVVEAPRVAQHCLPGQFVIVKADEEGERIPLTICDYDREAGTITIVFMPIGESTKKMKELKAGDAFMDFVGPLGQPSEFCSEDIEELKKKRIVFVAGGVGTAPVYPQLKWLHEHGITADAIVGAKTKDLVILEKEMSAVSNLYIENPTLRFQQKWGWLRLISPSWISGSQSPVCHDVIAADDGYYIIRCLNKFEKDLTEENKEKIRVKKKKERFENEYQTFVKNSTFCLNDNLWDDVTLKDVSGIGTDSFFSTYEKYFTTGENTETT